MENKDKTKIKANLYKTDKNIDDEVFNNKIKHLQGVHNSMEGTSDTKENEGAGNTGGNENG